MHITQGIAGALIAVCWLADGAASQTDIPIERVLCESCRIELEEMLVLSDEHTPYKFSDPVRVEVHGNRVYVVSSVEPGKVAVFDPDGRFVTQFGSRGEGPGEFVNIVAIDASTADSLYVYDFNLHRISVYSTRGDAYEYERVIPAPIGAGRILVLPESGYVLSGFVPSRESIGYPLHAYRQDGQFIRSFGVEQPVMIPGDQHLMSRYFARSADDSYWTVHGFRFILERWNSEGQLLGRLTGSPSWMEPGASPSPDPFLAGASTSIGGLALTDAARLWLVARVPDDDWNPRARSPDNSGAMTRTELNETYDMIVEMIEPASARVVASQRFDDFMYHVPGKPLLFRVDIEGDHAIIRMWRAVMRRESG